MDNKKLGTLLILAIGIVLVIGMLFCVSWIPGWAFNGAFWNLNGSNPTPYNEAQKIWIIELVVYELTTIPCFIIVCLGAKFSLNINEGKIYCDQNLKIVNICKYMLGIALIVFITECSIFDGINFNVNFMEQLTIFLFGVAIDIGFFILDGFLSDAKEKEDLVDGTV